MWEYLSHENGMSGRLQTRGYMVARQLVIVDVLFRGESGCWAKKRKIANGHLYESQDIV